MERFVLQKYTFRFGLAIRFVLRIINVETLVEIDKYLNVEIQDLFWPIENIAINDLSEE